MEIKIQTKFSLKENVFFLKDNKIKKGYIRFINIESKINESEIYEPKIDSIIKYTVHPYYSIHSKDSIEMNEDELFITIEELEKNLL